MRLLVVAMPHSVHTARWLNQLAGSGWDVHVFPSQDTDVHPELREVTVHGIPLRSPSIDATVKTPGALPWPTRAGRALAGIGLRRLRDAVSADSSRAARLHRLVRRLQPDAIHSLEIQHAGYLIFDARQLAGGAFPPWIVSNWGSDIFLFGRLPEHAGRIRAVLSSCQYYHCECQRDVELAQEFGFRGHVLPVIPNSGGIDVAALANRRAPGASSARRLIVLKGYQGWAGRALVGVRALELVAEKLAGYRLAVYLASSDVSLAARLMGGGVGMPVEIIPESPHRDILTLHGHARMSIGLSIGDAISTSVLEAMAMGSLPVQSWTSCANEWVRDGESALLVPPEDPRVVADAIVRAAEDDDLVDTAARLNAETVRTRLDATRLRETTLAMYERVISDRPSVS